MPSTPCWRSRQIPICPRFMALKLSPGFELRVALGERLGRLVGRPGGQLDVERLDSVELGPVPRLAAERAALGREQRAVDGLDVGHVGLDAEPVADRSLEIVLGRLE